MVSALKADLGIVLEVKDYSKHALTEGSGASAVAYVECVGADGTTWWGVGRDSSSSTHRSERWSRRRIEPDRVSVRRSRLTSRSSWR